jgi:hypothetical protein
MDAALSENRGEGGVEDRKDAEGSEGNADISCYIS